jgi:hypothetical protein
MSFHYDLDAYVRKNVPASAINKPWSTGAQFMAEHWEVPIVISIAYVIMLFGGQYIMKKREEVKLYWTLIGWNILQSLFSYAVAYYFWIDGGALATIRALGFFKGMSYESCTLVSEYSNTWVYFFCLSKIPDMIDTFLLVIRKRQVILLHWYHHISVMLFCWVAWGYRIENGGLFAGMNAVIHSIMYTYYTIASTGVRFPNVMRSMVTMLQIVQMVLGTCISIHNIVMCNFDPMVQYAGLFMYISYLLLFLQFFYVQYIAPKPKVEAGKEKKH